MASVKSTKNQDPNCIMATKRQGEDQDVALARTLMSPTVQAAVTLKGYCGFYENPEGIDLSGLIESLTEQTKTAIDGNLKRGEGMLTTQAHTLDAIFNCLAQRAAANMGEYLSATETYLKLALRAQSQCRSTWEALSAIKNPPVASFVKQANIAHGHQQVNNGTTAGSGRLGHGEKYNSAKRTIGEE